MNEQPATRQELYDRIREASRDEVILEEMIRLGFWPAEGEMPSDPADEVRRRGELSRQLRSLVTESRRLEDIEKLKVAMREQRMAESRRKRQQTKQRRLEERAERSRRLQERKTREILYLGEGVSAGLNHRESDAEKLARAGLPQFSSEAELARAMGNSLGELRFLAFFRRAATVTHYRRFLVAKKTGGHRLISAPMPRLKRAQEWLLENILEKVAVHEAAHGFRRGRSIVSGAQPHVGADVVVNLDLEDFFPTVTYRRIKGVFRKLGYAESLATVFALLTSEPEVDTVELDGTEYHVARPPRFLPQGAPTSPALTNMICRGLDARLAGLASSLGYTYTRYADDLTFSGSGEEACANVGRLLRRTRFIVGEEGFRVHPEKTRILRSGNRQEVTGLTVNDRLGVSRKVLRRFRATLFQIERDGPAGKRWGNGDDVIASIEGFANFVAMVDAEKGRAFQEQVRRIIDRHGRGGGRARPQRCRWQPRPAAPAQPEVVDATLVEQPAAQPAAKKKKKPWWKFW